MYGFKYIFSAGFLRNPDITIPNLHLKKLKKGTPRNNSAQGLSASTRQSRNPMASCHLRVHCPAASHARVHSVDTQVWHMCSDGCMLQGSGAGYGMRQGDGQVSCRSVMGLSLSQSHSSFFYEGTALPLRRWLQFRSHSTGVQWSHLEQPFSRPQCLVRGWEGGPHRAHGRPAWDS